MPERGPVRPPVIVVGAFPPPVHGMTRVTERIAGRLERDARGVERADIATGRLERGVAYHATKLARVAAAALRLARGAPRSGERRALYLAVDGGWGIVYGIALSGLARWLGYRRVLHHHNYSYLVTSRRTMRWFTGINGENALHVTLCEAMGRRLRALYPKARATRVVSNAAWIAAPAERRAAGAGPGGERGPLRLGHLGNLDRRKGLDLVCETYEALAERGVAVRLRLAGPAASAWAGRRVTRMTAAHGSGVEYLGPVAGEAKRRFFASIDVLLFPSRLPEAEPLVIWEALAAGVPVIGTRSGCIAGMLAGGAGHAVAGEGDFLAEAVPRLTGWASDRAALERAARAARERFAVARADAERQVHELAAAIAAAGERSP